MRFCPSCGEQPSTAVQSKPCHDEKANAGRYICPQCGNSQLTAIVEPVINNGLEMRGASRNNWVCQNCGTIFRNLKDLKNEIALESKRGIQSRNAAFICFALAVIIIFAAVQFSSGILEVLLFLVFGGSFCFAVGVYLLAIFIYIRKKLVKLEEEKDYLEENSLMP